MFNNGRLILPGSRNGSRKTNLGGNYLVGLISSCNILTSFVCVGREASGVQYKFIKFRFSGYNIAVRGPYTMAALPWLSPSLLPPIKPITHLSAAFHGSGKKNSLWHRMMLRVYQGPRGEKYCSTATRGRGTGRGQLPSTGESFRRPELAQCTLQPN